MARRGLDRSTGAPAFRQLKQLLRQGILDGSIAGRIDSERELASRHGIAYMTARRAVDALVAEHLVQRVPGVGTFVCRTGGPIARSGNVGLVLSAAIRHSSANPYYGAIVEGALGAARRAGVSVFVGSTSDELMPRPEDQGSRRKVDGLIALGRPDAAGQAALATAAQFVPVVSCNAPALAPGMPAVWGDDRAAGVLAATHLLERGYRRLAWIGCPGSDTAAARLAGFTATLAAGGVDPATLLRSDGDYEMESGERAGRDLLMLTGPPRAIACANDAMACGVLKAAHAAGAAVPATVAVLGFDDLVLDRYLPQPLTSVGSDREAMGAAAVDALLALLAGRAVPERIILPCRLAVRATT